MIMYKMGKRNILLTGEDSDIAMAKARGINMSAFFREVLRVELDVKELHDAENKEQLILKLKSRIGILSTELEVKAKEIESLQRDIKDYKKDIKKWKERAKEDDGYVDMEFPPNPM